MATMLELAEKGAQIFAAQEAAQYAAELQRLEDEEAREAAALGKLRGTLGVEDVELWQELDPHISGSRFSVQAFGVRCDIYPDLSGWCDVTLAGRGKPSPDSLSVFIYNARRRREITMAKAIAYLSDDDGRDPTYQYRNAQSVCNEVAGLWDSPEVAEAQRAYLLRNEIVGIEHTPEWQWYDTWLEEAERLGIDTSGVKESREKAWQFCEMVHDAYERSHFDDDEPKNRAFVEWLQEAPDAYGIPEAREASKYRDFLVTALERLEKVMKEGATRRKVEELEKKAFYPFRYYEVGYAALTQDEDGENPEVGIYYDTALNEPQRDGWYRDCHRYLKRVFNPVSVKIVEVRRPGDMSYRWFEWREEDGVRYRVPREDVERIY